MNNRERFKHIMHYESYDHMPLTSFGYWDETLIKWKEEGYLPKELVDTFLYNGDAEDAYLSIMKEVGFEMELRAPGGDTGFLPPLEEKVIRVEEDGCIIKSNDTGHIIRVKPGVTSIPSEVGTLLTDRKAWEEIFLPRMQFSAERASEQIIESIRKGREKYAAEPFGVYCGGLFGRIRDIFGLEGLSYMMADDPELFEEVVERNAQISLFVVEKILESGIDFDFAHFWEDICYKTGPLVNPKFLERVIGPYYKKITDALKAHGVDIVTLDCDGCIDKLIPLWLYNGVNAMYPIEVGTWGANIAPWRAQYGKALRGVGGVDKRVFAKDKKAIDEEIERLKPLVDLGGYIPCIDHRIPPDAKFELVQYYCNQFRKAFN